MSMNILSLMNSVQPRNGPNGRPPNSIFGSSGTSSQQFLSPQLICGFTAAISCGVAFITYINYTLNYLKHTSIGIETVLISSLIIVTLFVTGILFMSYRPNKPVLVVCVQPSITDHELENWVPPDISNDESVGNPPSYDLAMTMPKMTKIPTDSLPPSYNNIFMV